MKHTVIWSPDALNQLTELWLNALDRDAVTSAVEQIDRVLSGNPKAQGESRFGDRRVLIVPPLVVAFDVQQHANRVVVVGVGPSRRRI